MLSGRGAKSKFGKGAWRGAEVESGLSTPGGPGSGNYRGRLSRDRLGNRAQNQDFAVTH